MNRTIKIIVTALLFAAAIFACKKEDKPSLPTVTTGNAVSVTTKSATITSTVTFDDNSQIVARGICWSTSPNPTIGNSFTTDSLTSGLATANLSGLQFGATYYYRAYAANVVGTAYGEEKSFTTIAIALPELSAVTAIETSPNEYSISSTVLSTGNGTILSKGFCISSSPYPTINDEVEADTSVSDRINNIVLGHTYVGSRFVRSYATNEVGTSYSEPKQLGFNWYDDDVVNPNPNCPDCPIALKPNIYLYPTKTEQLKVSLAFPQSGNVVTSIPDYGQGWDVNVQPDGTIDKRYGYLFYESAQPDVWQKTKGWSVKKADLKLFFEQNLAQYGFAGKEISDFTDYWVPLLSEYEYFSIFPQEKQTVSSVINLSISHTPDNIQRLFYFIEGANSPVALAAPSVTPGFARTGFYATEWGVVLGKGTKISK